MYLISLSSVWCSHAALKCSHRPIKALSILRRYIWKQDRGKMLESVIQCWLFCACHYVHGICVLLFYLKGNHTVKYNAYMRIAFKHGFRSFLTYIQHFILKKHVLAACFSFVRSNKSNNVKATQWRFCFSVWHVAHMSQMKSHTFCVMYWIFF